MERGREFLKAQVHNAVMQHRTLLENLEDHARQAQDTRYKTLCNNYLPRMREHQRMLEDYQATVGEADAAFKDALGTVLGKARNAVDAFRNSDFLRLVGDIVTIRQAQDTAATFASVGDRIGEPRLSEIGRMSERDHDAMQRDFNLLAQEMFVDHVQGTA